MIKHDVNEVNFDAQLDYAEIEGGVKNRTGDANVNVVVYL